MQRWSKEEKEIVLKLLDNGNTFQKTADICTAKFGRVITRNMVSSISRTSLDSIRNQC